MTNDPDKSEAISKTEAASKGKINWIGIILSGLIGLALFRGCEHLQLQEGMRQGVEEARLKCLARDWSQSACDCLVSEARSRVSRLSLEQIKNMSRADIEAINEEAKKACGMY